MTIEQLTFMVALLTAFLAYDLVAARNLRGQEWYAVIRKSVLSKVIFGAIVVASIAAYTWVFGGRDRVGLG
jgi:fructose-specific phosphotransferase system IIC component